MTTQTTPDSVLADVVHTENAIVVAPAPSVENLPDREPSTSRIRLDMNEILGLKRRA